MVLAVSCKKDPAATVITQCITEDATGVHCFSAILNGVVTVAKNAVVSLQQGTKYCYFAIAVIDGEEYLGERAYFETPKDYGEAVDLGLSVKWRSCNLGASNPEDNGDYYAWGETAPKNNYTWANYTGDVDTGLMDDNYKDDAARQALGGKWRVPTNAEWWELRNNCSDYWVSDYNGTGISGYVFYSANGNSIFLPAAGMLNQVALTQVGTMGLYWTSTVNDTGSCEATYAIVGEFNRTNFYNAAKERCVGMTVRPVWEE